MKRKSKKDQPNFIANVKGRRISIHSNNKETYIVHVFVMAPYNDKIDIKVRCKGYYESASKFKEIERENHHHVRELERIKLLIYEQEKNLFTVMSLVSEQEKKKDKKHIKNKKVCINSNDPRTYIRKASVETPYDNAIIIETRDGKNYKSASDFKEAEAENDLHLGELKTIEKLIFEIEANMFTPDPIPEEDVFFPGTVPDEMLDE